MHPSHPCYCGQFPDWKIRTVDFTRRQPGTQLALAAARAAPKILRMTVRLILALAGLTTALMAPANADPIATCTVPPVPPVACSNQDAKCICDANGSCRWIYNCTHPGAQQ
jgi:hypothetical protein